jgi:3',5'-cyclic AMP phosphodiesterase CpdA
MIAVPGNHDWEVSSGAPFFAYFGSAAGPAGVGYFSTTLGAWHVIVLNSNVAAGPGSAQYEWLKADLQSSPAPCTVALWHHPLFSSGQNGNSPQMRDAWRLLQSAGADIVLNGHDHDYERYALQDADGRLDPRGIREFVVGTGGASLYDRVRPQPNAEAYDNRTFGVLRLTLKATGYDWRFVPIDGQTYTDSGSAACVM